MDQLKIFFFYLQAFCFSDQLMDLFNQLLYSNRVVVLEDLSPSWKVDEDGLYGVN